MERDQYVSYIYRNFYFRERIASLSNDNLIGDKVGMLYLQVVLPWTLVSLFLSFRVLWFY